MIYYHIEDLKSSIFNVKNRLTNAVKPAFVYFKIFYASTRTQKVLGPTFTLPSDASVASVPGR